jgi:hypothetical protein
VVVVVLVVVVIVVEVEVLVVSVQLPLAQKKLPPDKQSFPHVPQLAGSVWRSVHPVAQCVWPAGQPPAHAPPAHNAPPGQTCPHVPQLFESVWRSGQPSQQLVQLPTVPCLAVQRAASCLILHVGPLVVVRQQVTAPGLPHVEWDAHFLTKPVQRLFTRTVFACCTAQLT